MHSNIMQSVEGGSRVIVFKENMIFTFLKLILV